MYPAYEVFAVLTALTSAQECNKPTLAVQNALKIGNKLHVRKGTVKAYCYSDSSDNLTISAEEKHTTSIINDTTIVAHIEPSSSSFWLKCSHNSNCYEERQIVIKRYPDINSFNCFTKNLEYLNCSWTIDSKQRSNYTLSATEWTSNWLICKGRIGNKKTYSCIWDLSNLSTSVYILPYRIDLHLQVCDVMECLKQRKPVNLKAVTKLDPPEIVRLQVNGSDIEMNWKIPFGRLATLLKVYYVIEYWFTGTHPEIVASNITPTWWFPLPLTNKFKVPCPDKEYMIRVSCRPDVATPEFMSDFGYASFRMGPLSGETDPVCKRRAVMETPPVMLYKTEVLARLVDESLKIGREKKKRLEQKADVIKALLLRGDS